MQRCIAPLLLGQSSEHAEHLALPACQVARSQAKLGARLQKHTFPLDYDTALGAIRDALLAVSFSAIR